MPYKYSKPYAKIRFGAPSCADIHARDADMPGLILATAGTIEGVSEGLYIASIDSALHGNGRDMIYTIDIEVRGPMTDLKELVTKVNRGKLFHHADALARGLAAAAGPVIGVPVRDRRKLHVTVSNTDEPAIVRNVAMSILRHAGTWHSFHGETINSGRYPGTADFYIDAVAGFDCAERARGAMRALRELPYDEVRVRPLWDAGDHDLDAMAVAA